MSEGWRDVPRTCSDQLDEQSNIYKTSVKKKLSSQYVKRLFGIMALRVKA